MFKKNLTWLATRALRYSTQPIQSESFRINEINTGNHLGQHCSKFYQLPSQEIKKVFASGGLPKSFEKQTKTFGETCLMVRKPALEIIHNIRTCDLGKPVVRFVIYGNDGTGKSLTMAHLLHYGMQHEFLLVHIPWVPNWFKKPKEVSNSITYEGFIDLPFDAAAWLVHFKVQNSTLLAKLDLRTTREYVWSKRETTPTGVSLLELIEHGIARVKFACNTVEVLIEELKAHATEKRCKVMVAIDGFNAFFYPRTRIVSDTKLKIPPNKITLTKPFLNITNHDWCNGVCILTVDRIALTADKMESVLPRYQLGKNGFEHLDPFVPVEVKNYNEKEMENCINYYIDRRWIQNVEEGLNEELKSLSGFNPYNLMNVCAPL